MTRATENVLSRGRKKLRSTSQRARTQKNKFHSEAPARGQQIMPHLRENPVNNPSPSRSPTSSQMRTPFDASITSKIVGQGIVCPAQCGIARPLTIA